MWNKIVVSEALFSRKSISMLRELSTRTKLFSSRFYVQRIRRVIRRIAFPIIKIDYSQILRTSVTGMYKSRACPE